ncbi:DNase I-like protein [Lindgomyces ingoldianus]|uniref:DNase I-like protein n=1 Tax=Lindgomyces ingoldianus TaxID=673940 RepID=A0ACB6RFF1_9PLEO|nr:DNase I-like protein [Lindgomyces ingoldianus]KAF2477999.1 DNase I-like protein [Lindgomyces ingoldianus]
MADHAKDPPSSLRILSLNCWGLKYIAKWRHERLAEIGNQIAAADPPPDIVGLQECWTQQDYNAIREKTRHLLPHGKFYWSGIFGGGLAILSRWPIEESSMMRYPLNGRPAAFYRGDWFVGKGVACARIRMGPTRRDVAEVFCTHLHAPYETEPFDSYLCHRTAQAWEIAKLMRGAAERGHLVIGLGDFNMVPLSLAHRIIETHSPVRDVWRILHPNSSVGAAKDKVEKLRGLPMPSAEFNMTANGATCDSALNTWRWNEAHKKRLFKGENITIESSVDDPSAKRLDYIFFSSGAQHHATTAEPSAEWALKEANVGMTMRHPTLHCSLSDHYSVEATLTRSLSEPSSAIANGAWALPETYLPLETYDEILADISAYDARERHQRRLRMGHFVLQFVITIGCLVAVWWSPHNYVSFILMFISSLGLSAGVIEGLMGGLFVGSELRALREFEWEVRNAKDRAIASKGSSKSEGLHHLTDDQKQKYRPVLQNFWSLISSKPAGSQEHQTARAKLAEWSQKLINQERMYRQRTKSNPPPGQQPQPASQNQQQQQNQQSQVQNQNPSPPLSQQAGTMSTPQQQPVARPQAQQNGQQPQINPDIIRHVQQFQYHLPPQGPHPGTPEGDLKIKDFRNSYLMALNKQEKSTHRVKAFVNMMEQRRQLNQEVPQELINQKQQAEQEYNNAKKYVEEFRKKQAQWKLESEQRRSQQQQQQQSQTQTQTQTQPAAQPQNQQSQQQNVAKPEPQIKVEGGPAPQPAQQFGNMQGGGGGGVQQQQQNTQGPATQVSQQQPLRQPPAPHSQQMQQPSQTTSFQQPGQPAHQQQRPQINPQQANAHAQHQSNSPHPQSATSNPAGPPVPLSHKAAVIAANRSYSNPDPQRTNTPMATGQQGNFHAPGSREREQLNNPKMPIPRTLNVTQPTPVGMGQARPTMSGPTNGAPGPMGQPVIAKLPPFQLEGEGDRVLSKRKLDELALTPEVEEAMLQLADDFVDTVISSSCKLSKLRESPQLDIRDIQLVLERNYNIRIPGYASDEVRTVRKLVPAPGWTQKMNLVQGAKVMGGKSDI